MRVPSRSTWIAAASSAAPPAERPTRARAARCRPVAGWAPAMPSCSAGGADRHRDVSAEMRYRWVRGGGWAGGSSRQRYPIAGDTGRSRTEAREPCCRQDFDCRAGVATRGGTSRDHLPAATGGCAASSRWSCFSRCCCCSRSSSTRPASTAQRPSSSSPSAPAAHPAVDRLDTPVPGAVHSLSSDHLKGRSEERCAR